MGHLRAFDCTFTQEAKGSAPEREYAFVVEFSSHCFTRGPNKHRGETLNDVDRALHYKDSRDTRIFCFQRYKLSHRLPDIAREITYKSCYHTGKGNFFVVELVNDNDEKQEYEVYFKVSRASKGKLRLYIESAYIRDSQHGSSQPIRKKIKFFVIAFNVKSGKPIKPPK